MTIIDEINVTSEVGKLKKIVVHHPDDGVGIFPPRRMHDILYDDIVDHHKMKLEHSQYLETLYWFLDPATIKANIDILESERRLELFTPGSDIYMSSRFVLDIEYMLAEILKHSDVKGKLVAAVGAAEILTLPTQDLLLKKEPKDLALTLLSGVLEVSKQCTHQKSETVQIFPPIPNQIFTRDSSVTIADHIFITKPRELARYRERLISGYIAKYFLLNRDGLDTRIIDLDAVDPKAYPGSDERLTIEGGDMMMVAPKHLLVGLSRRTNIAAIESLINDTFKRKVLEKVTVIKIPEKRDYMHIDTIFTQVKKNMWVLFGPFSKMGYERTKKKTITSQIMEEEIASPVSIYQYKCEDSTETSFKQFNFLEDLLDDISVNDLGSTEATQFVYSAGGELLFEEREQWTDSCNFLALEDGIIMGYDRNYKTANALREAGFNIIKVEELNKLFRETSLNGGSMDEVLKPDTLILLNSHELSRARGGSHCLSQPILRDVL